MSSSPAPVSLKRPEGFFIDGVWAKPSSSSTFDVLNSATEGLFLRVAEAQEADEGEILGPGIGVFPADDVKHAVEIANDSVYGLNASVFTNDIDRACVKARKLRSASVGHNAFRFGPSIASGGVKQSGFGREGGTEGLLELLESKTVLLDELPTHA